MNSEIHYGKQVSPQCEYLVGSRQDVKCGKPTEFAYPAQGRGYMCLCGEHAEKHRAYCETVTIVGDRAYIDP